jgi:sarcosine oxidase
VSVSYSGRYDAIVVGVGGMGSATSYYLARRGKRVLGLERFGIPHSMGSSHGHTRIIRLAYYEHPSYVLLLKRAYELWREIQQTAGERLLHVTESIDAGPEGSWVFKGSWESCKLHDLPHEVLTGSELHRRYPGYHLPPNHLALVQPEGGFLTPEKCIVSYVIAAQARGAEIHARERVLEWDPLEGGVRVRTDRGVYEADRLVVTAGAWDAELLDVLDGLAVPERQVLAWLQPTRPERFRPDVFPVFNLLVDEGRFYGFPVFGVPGFKFGKYHHLEENVDPEGLDREAHDYDERLLRDFAERYFPDGCGPTMDLQTCMFTNTPDNHFVIDLHPDYPQVSFASPCSGHGYKFASVIGEIMADLAQTGVTRHDISLFRLDRLGRASGRAAGRLPGVLHSPMGSTQTEPNGHHDGRSQSFPRAEDVRPFW